MSEKIWTHSGDSHFLEPPDLWHQIMPRKLADRMPRSEKVGDDEERIHVDGKSFTRKLPKIMTVKGSTGESRRRLRPDMPKRVKRDDGREYHST